MNFTTELPEIFGWSAEYKLDKIREAIWYLNF